MLPMMRKSRCWERFAETYAKVSKDASDDFTELFGDAFSHAYDDQIARLGRARRGTR
jgi:predicted component of type VI protein secretion system